MSRLLVADDDVAVREAIGRALEVEGYEVWGAPHGDGVLAAVRDWQPEAIVLDVMMPGLDGLAVCRRLRARGDRTPILIVTARQHVSDRIDGLDAGADDYLVKPFELDELLARVRALLRRAYPDAEGRVAVGAVSMDLATREADIGWGPISLTRTEAALLELFLRNPGQVLTRELIEERIWGSDLALGSNSLDVYVSYLRRKLERPGHSRVIDTVRGIGYRLGRPD